MEFLISDTFTESLGKLTGQEQRAVKTAAFDLQMNPANPGIRLHRIERAKDNKFWSVSVNMDIRIIVHRTEGSLLLCYVDHHNRAYQWAVRRKLETHPKTGAAQLVEIRETVREMTIPTYVETESSVSLKPLLFPEISDDELLSYGVPPEWLEDVRQINEDSLLELADHLPSEAAEALLDLAIGVTPQKAPSVTEGFESFEHPDAQRRFRVMKDSLELERAFEYPWEKWAVFLHPAQKKLIDREYNGPARVSGSAGTGKTIVALHRAVRLVSINAQYRVFLTTFSDTLAYALHTKLSRLISNEPRLGERLEVQSIKAIGLRLYQLNFERPNIASREVIMRLLLDAAKDVKGHKFGLQFLIVEWEDVVDAWQLSTWEAYRDVLRLGRKKRLPEKQRAMLWNIFDRVRSGLKSKNLITYSQLFNRLATHFKGNNRPPFDYTIVDEAQDVSIAQLKFLSAIASKRDSLFFSGDLGQRIFQQPFSWKALGIDIRGRSYTLKINYRMSHQIRKKADRLLEGKLVDVDGNIEERNKTQSVFNGPKPTILVADSLKEEGKAVKNWLLRLKEDGVLPGEIGIFVRSSNEIDRATSAVKRAGFQYVVLDEKILQVNREVTISTMHLAKGLEFRAVSVMACDDEIIPSQERIEKVADETDLEEVYNTERHLLYVACTRARDYLLVTSVCPESEFVDDLLLEN